MLFPCTPPTSFSGSPSDPNEKFSFNKKPSFQSLISSWRNMACEIFAIICALDIHFLTVSLHITCMHIIFQLPTEILKIQKRKKKTQLVLSYLLWSLFNSRNMEDSWSFRSLYITHCNYAVVCLVYSRPFHSIFRMSQHLLKITHIFMHPGFILK